MSAIYGFTVLIERRLLVRLPALIWMLLAALVVLVAAMPAQARPDFRGMRGAIARDLAEGLDSVREPRARWARHLRGERHVQVVVLSDDDDANMASLSNFVTRLGGEVLVRHGAVRGMTVQMPARRVRALARHPDVVSISPNRELRTTASSLEAIAGATTTTVRSYSSTTAYTGLDGTGVGIAILDSGVMKAHKSLANASGASRVLRNVNMLNATLANWTGAGGSASLAPGSSALNAFETAVANDNAVTQDAYGHGTHVASVAAGRGFYQSPDSTGMAPNANIYDVKVLNELGIGNLSDTLEGIQWVIYNAKRYNIRVMNLSLAAASTESWQTDPLCIAVRSATAAGITVVVSGGNFGLTLTGKEILGTIGAPGNDPSVITVGATNFKDTTARADDIMTGFSSRGPTRGALVDQLGVRQPDNLLKPDLVAPGNKVIGASATAASSSAPTKNKLATLFPTLESSTGASQAYAQRLIMLSGTSVSAPVVAGAAALLLQANPGLTPPLIKAILQYTAQPLPGANLLQQGAGQLNIHGAVALAMALRTDIASGVASGAITSGTSLLASGKSMPATSSTVGGTSFNWSRIVYAGGNRVMSGTALFTKFQPIYDPKITWAGAVVRKRVPVYWSGEDIASNTYVKDFTETTPTAQSLLTSQVVDAGGLAGFSSFSAKTGVFLPTATLTGWLVSGSGVSLGSGISLASGVILSEGMIVSEGVILSEGMIVSEGVILSEGMIVSEGVILSETGQGVQGFDTRGALGGEQ